MERGAATHLGNVHRRWRAHCTAGGQAGHECPVAAVAAGPFCPPPPAAWMRPRAPQLVEGSYAEKTVKKRLPRLHCIPRPDQKASCMKYLSMRMEKSG